LDDLTIKGARAAGVAKANAAILAEILLASLVVASVGYVAWRFFATGHFSHPFQSNPEESLMDFYNTAYWAHHSGAYAVWHTVYPPLSFVLLRLWTTPSCYKLSAYMARDCDIHAMAPIIGFYTLNVGLVFKSFHKRDPGTAIMRTIALCAGLPMLYGLELANLIIPCFTTFVLAQGELIRSGGLRRLCLALSINFKPYLLLVVLPQVVRRQWRWLTGLGLAGAAVYLTTLALEGAGSPADMLRDILVYAGGAANLYAYRNHFGVGSQGILEIWNAIFPGLIRLGQLGVAACYVMAWFAPARVDGRRFIALTLTAISGEAALRTQGYSADYTQIFLLFMIFTEQWRGAVGVAVIVSAYLLCLSVDYAILPVHVLAESYFGKRAVLADYGVFLSQFVRPAFLLVIQYGLLALTVRDLQGDGFSSASDGEPEAFAS
jgi:hypothetical protein